MRKAFYASAIALLGLAAGPVQAAQGCGAGFHLGPYGHCIRNGVAVAPAVVAPAPGVVVGAPAVVAPRTYFMYGGRRCYWARPGVRACI
jgi:hypothetical protein